MIERNWLHPSHPQNHETIRFVISILKKEIARIEVKMAAHISINSSGLFSLLSEVNGVGATTVAVLLAVVLEPGTLSRRLNACWETYNVKMRWCSASQERKIG